MHTNKSEVSMVLYINTATIESRTSLRDRRAIRSVMSGILEIEDQSIDDEPVLSARDINLNDLFDKVIQTRNLNGPAQSDSESEARLLQLRTRMRKQLYPYQEQAIAWMVSRELHGQYARDPLPSPSLYKEVALKNGASIYYNPFRNHIKVQQEVSRDLSSGGLLCDEMGLGKTVEVLGCVLVHKRRIKDTTSSKKGRRILSDSSGSDEDDEMPLSARAVSLSQVPVITRPAKVRMRRFKAEPVPVPPAQSRRIPEEFKRYQPGTNLQALQRWYADKLSTYDETARMSKTGRQRELEISCVCGTSAEDGGSSSSSSSSKLARCSECGIHQHAACFGFQARRLAAPYVCSGCWKRQPLLKTGATLIVCPPRLLAQWQHEIRKHVRGELRVLVYLGGSRLQPVYPTELQRHDVVLTTYAVLQSDLLLTESSGKRLRQRARYCPPAAPIARVHWWRLVLDEAQLVETPTRCVSRMAKLLSASHRWAITGTPVTNGLEDLLGIIDYLIMEPYTNPDIWYFKLMRPYLTDNEAPMLNFLAKILWRTEKRHIQDQIDIPKQSFDLTWLDFSQIESFFYAREYEASKSLFIQKLDALDMPVQTPIRNLPVRALAHILAPVLTLRHACSHFSAVRGRYLASKKPLNSLTDLLDALVHKNSVDFEDNMRIAISAWNGMAGVQLLLGHPAQGADLYRKVLRLRETLREPTTSMHVEMDNLQIIHSLHNLITVLEEHGGLKADADNVERLREERRKHEKMYIDKFDVEVLKAKKEFDEAEATIGTVLDECDFDEIWDVYATVDRLVNSDMYGRFVKMMEGHPLMTNDRCLDRLNIGQHLELLSMVDRWQTKLTSARDVCVTGVVELAEFRLDEGVVSLSIAASTVTSAVDCHLRISSQVAVANGERPPCPVCTADRLLNDYEALLYNKQWKKPTKAAAQSKGNWAPSVEEIALQCIARLALQLPSSGGEEARVRGHAQKQLLDGMRKELKAARALWLKMSYSVNSRDELNSCKMRLAVSPEAGGGDRVVRAPVRSNILRSLMQEDDDRLERIHLLNRNELDYQHVRLNNEAELAVREFERLQGTNLYLSTLRGKDARAGGEGRALDPCPICRNDLDATFHMMPCGHCYCVNCLHTLAGDGVRNTVPCAICRLRHHLKDINFLQIRKEARPSAEPNSEEAAIRGNCSTKLAAAIRLVVRLRKHEPAVKVLIYSIWDTVLAILLQALRENGVCAVHMLGNDDRQLEQFRDGARDVTALLLRISSGSKGLTLIEATHVLFLDPVLDPRDELQAVSRIHRIGQTRPTAVHRFLMRDSIDESIYNVTNKNASQSIGWKETTIAQLKELYIHT